MYHDPDFDENILKPKIFKIWKNDFLIVGDVGKIIINEIYKYNIFYFI